MEADYSKYRNAHYRHESVIRIILSSAFVLYSMIAPILIRKLSAKSQADNLIRQFVPLGIAALVLLLMNVLVMWSKWLKKHPKLKAVIFEAGGALFVAGGFIFDMVSVYFAAKEGRDVSYLVFIITAMMDIAVITIEPFSFMLMFFIGLVTFSVEVRHLNAYPPDPTVVYNVMVMAVMAIILYWLRYISEQRNFKRSREIERMAANREEYMIRLTHELRTPLNAILGKNYLIRKETGEEIVKQLSDEIESSGQIMLLTVNDILDQAKLEAGKMRIINADYSVEELIETCERIMHTEAANHELEFKVELPESIPSVLNGDAIRIKQILINLISNAIKYTPQGSVTLGLTYTELDGDSCRLCFSVKDTGIGIRQENIPFITEEFTRFDEKRNREVTGTGLGLSITSSLLKLMGSELKVESVYGEGSVFSFEIEQKIVERITVAAKKERADAEPKLTFTARGAKVLVVDDNMINYAVCKGLIKSYGVATNYARSGEECLNLVANGGYDLIFLDHIMPDMDGVETLNRLRNEYPKIYEKTPIIALTAYSESDSAAQYRKLGFSGYLAKPLEPKEMERCLFTYLPKKKIKLVEVTETEEGG